MKRELNCNQILSQKIDNHRVFIRLYTDPNLLSQWIFLLDWGRNKLVLVFWQKIFANQIKNY